MTPRSASLTRFVAAAALTLAGGVVIAGPEWAAMAILAIALLMIAALPRVGPEPTQRPVVELARCRRHGIEGHVMVASLASRTGPGRRRRIAGRLTRSLRITDGIIVLERWHRGSLLCGVFTDQAVETERIERRLRSLEPGLDFGWARFPADGVTLEALLTVARARSVSPAPALRAALPLRPRPTLGMQTSSASSWREEG